MYISFIVVGSDLYCLLSKKWLLDNPLFSTFQIFVQEEGDQYEEIEKLNLKNHTGAVRSMGWSNQA